MCAPRQRRMPVCPSECRPGCGHTHRPCGPLPTGIRASSWPGARRDRVDDGVVAARQPQHLAVGGHAAHVRAAAAWDPPLPQHLPRPEADDRDRALAAVRRVEQAGVAARVEPVHAAPGLEEAAQRGTAARRSSRGRRPSCRPPRTSGRPARASRPAASMTARRGASASGSRAGARRRARAAGPENSQLATARVPSAVKSMWSTPAHGTCTDRFSSNVFGSRKSSRCRRSATTIE